MLGSLPALSAATAAKLGDVPTLSGTLDFGHLPSNAELKKPEEDNKKHTKKKIVLEDQPEFKDTMSPIYNQLAQNTVSSEEVPIKHYASGGQIFGADLVKAQLGNASLGSIPSISRADLGRLEHSPRAELGSAQLGGLPSLGSVAMNLRPDLSPSVARGSKIQLQGRPKFAAEGGTIEDHNPEFYSEGGLGTIDNRYVKGDGDGTSDSVPAMLANGEFVIPADVVASLGNGSNDSGAHVLDEFLKTIREHKRKADAKHLPPDSKGVLGYLLEAKKRAK